MKNKTIGLSLSGGGHRATVFSLGVLLYLADVGLHRQIATISSVSGGSLASGFFATRKTPLCQQTSEQVEESVRTLAKMIAGRPAFYWIGLGLVAGVFAVWFLHFIGTIPFELPFWESQLCFFLVLVAVAMFAARSCGGTFWGWWGTWVYLGLTLPAFVVGIAIWWSEAHWALCLLVTIFSVTVPQLRCYIAERAFGATIFKEKESDLPLWKLQESPRYVFCATEMHTGRHALFSRDLVYVPRVGLAQPPTDLTVKSVVQMSANFPGAFPYRLKPMSGFQFHFSTYWEMSPPSWLVFCDGGVYDNMAVSWFVEAPKFAAKVEGVWSKINFVEQGKEQLGKQLRAQIDTMKAAKPDMLIVVNSAEPYTWKNVAQSVVPLFGEVKTLLGVTGSMYNQLGLTQLRSLRREFFLKPNSGALVSIGDSPGLWAGWLSNQTLVDCNI